MRIHRGAQFPFLIRGMLCTQNKFTFKLNIFIPILNIWSCIKLTILHLLGNRTEHNLNLKRIKYQKLAPIYLPKNENQA